MASLLLLFGPDLAFAQDEGGESVATRLRYENVDGDRIPVEEDASPLPPPTEK